MTTDLLASVGAGAFSGLIGDTISFPFTRIKTVFMAMPNGVGNDSPKRIGALFRHILQTQGMVGLYRGASPVLYSAVPGSALFFTGVEIAKKNLGEGPAGNALAGVFAQLFASVIWVPVEQFKELPQMLNLRKELQHLSPSQWMRHVLKTEGFFAFYKGFWAQFLTYAPCASMALALSGRVQKSMPDKYAFLINGASFGIAAAVTTPFDVIKTNLQIVTANPELYPDRTIQGCAKRLWDQGGVKSFFKGWQSRAIWLGTRQGIAFTCFPFFFDRIQGHFRKI